MLILCLSVPFGAHAAEHLKIGVLPAGDSLIVHAAAEDGFFAARGLDVEPVPFQSALELGPAMRAGALHGHFGDIINVLTQKESGSPQRIVTTTSRAGQGMRYFGLALAPETTHRAVTASGSAAGTSTWRIIPLFEPPRERKESR